MPGRLQRRPIHAIAAFAVLGGVIACTAGLPWWQGLAVAAAGAVVLGAEQLITRFRATRDQRRRTGLSFQEDRRCKGCDGDLWGLDVLPAKGGRYRVKCPECGAVTEFSSRKVRRPPKAKRQPAEADTRSFKIR